MVENAKFYVKWLTVIETQTHYYLSTLGFCLICYSLRKSWKYVVKAVRINSAKCSCVRIALCFSFTSFI